MRGWLVVAVGAALYAGAVVWMAGQLPPTGVPVHFDASGTPDRFGSRAEAVGSAATAGAVVAAIAVAALALVRWAPVRLLNVPHREYWTAPERVDRFRRMVGRDLALLLGGTLALLSLLPIGTVLATRADPVALPGLLAWALAGYLVAVGLWALWVVRYRYRPDRDR